MSTQAALLHDTDKTFLEILERDADELASKLQALQRRIFPPLAKKAIRRLNSTEAAKFIGIAEGYLRQIAADGKVALSEPPINGRRTYAVDDIAAIRHSLHATNPARQYIPHRQADDKLQIL